MIDGGRVNYVVDQYIFFVVIKNIIDLVKQAGWSIIYPYEYNPNQISIDNILTTVFIV